MSKVKQDLYRSTQAWVRVRDIQDGLFINDQNQRFCIFKVKPINFNLKSDGEKEIIINVFAELLRTNQNKISFYSRGHSTNLEKYLKRLSGFYKAEENNTCKDAILDEIRFAQEHASRRSVSISHYIIVEYVGFEGRSKRDKRRFRDELLAVSEEIQARLENVGLMVFLEPIIERDDDEICNLLYGIYNRKKFEDGVKPRRFKRQGASLVQISDELENEGLEDFEKEQAKSSILLFLVIVIALIIGLSITYFGLKSTNLFGSKPKPTEAGDDLYIQDEVEDFEEDEIAPSLEEKETLPPLDVEKLEDEFELELIEEESEEPSESSSSRKKDIDDFFREEESSSMPPESSENSQEAPGAIGPTEGVPTPPIAPPVAPLPSVPIYYPPAPTEPVYQPQPDPGFQDPGEGDFFFEDD